MGVLTWIVIGLIAGALATVLHTTPVPGGSRLMLTLGSIGAVVGGGLATILGAGSAGPLVVPGPAAAAVAGAALTLAVYSVATGATRFEHQDLGRT